MKCPRCNGKCGFWDYFGEWLDCGLCNETGKVSLWKRAKWFVDMKRLDIALKKEYKRPSGKATK